MNSTDRNELTKAGLRLAVMYVVADVEENCPRVNMPEGGRWFDTRPMLDPREHASPVIDMAVDALRFGEQAEALVRHHQHRHLVRVLVAPAEPKQWLQPMQQA
jgi:hypothetical protein